MAKKKTTKATDPGVPKQVLSEVKALLGISKSRFQESVHSSITTEWGVAWNEDWIARDIMQNFRDANKDAIESIKVLVKGDRVTITAPAEFDLVRLFYVGSEKSDADDIGQYGEGFKVAAVCLIRDFGVYPVACSGNIAVRIRAGDRVGNTELRPLVYDYFTVDEQPGSILVLDGCKPSLRRALAHGLDHFFYEGNSLLGKLLWSSYNDDFQLYKSTDKQGHIFYNNLKRSDIDGLPLIFVINKKYKAIESKIETDRDRNAFGDEVKSAFFKIYARHGIERDYDAQQIIVRTAKPHWVKGHPLLSAIAATYKHFNEDSCWPASKSKAVFGDKYFAVSKPRWGGDDEYYNNRLTFEATEKKWKDAGHTELPSYFSSFGVKSALNQSIKRKKKAASENQSRNMRPPGPAEMKAIKLLFEVAEHYAPSITQLFMNRRVNYKIILSETLLGELKEGHRYGSLDILLHKNIFTSTFGMALSTFLHEHSHIFGWDGSRAFSDALTVIMQELVDQRTELDEFDKRWARSVRSVEKEQGEMGETEYTVMDLVKNASVDELRAALTRLPLKEVKKALGK